MDIYQLMQEYKKKYGRDLDLLSLMRYIQPNSTTYTDSPDGRGSYTWMQDKYLDTNNDMQVGDYSTRKYKGEPLLDYNLMYGRLNDLHKIDPEAHREMQRRILDRGLGQDMTVWGTKNKVGM